MSARGSAFRLAFGGYVGTLVGGLVTVRVAFTDASPAIVAGAAVTGFLGGLVVGINVAKRYSQPPIRIGRRRRHGTVVLFSSLSFGLFGCAAMLGLFDPRVGVVALTFTFALLFTGWAAAELGETCYVDSITADEPSATWRWEPQGRSWLYAIFVVWWLLMGTVSVFSGDWTASIVRTGFATTGVCVALEEGTWRIETLGATPEIRVHEAGVVKQWPFRRSIVRWDEVDHVRLRDNELVLDRGLFDVRFERDEVADLEAVATEIERRLERVSADGPVALPR
ncbi:hypothetical protein [Natrinema caseinilyticum]|uniref:hypothetical protein n=1 Tax=Natrinema caseinilyticum TaxID=2961570 RepID=UPI0020C3B3A7|nr:hypothetical protein [Natrinema caseinilyticum]